MKISENSDSEKEVNLFLADHLQLFKAIYEDVRTCMLKNFYLKLHERILKEQIAIHSEAIAVSHYINVYYFHTLYFQTQKSPTEIFRPSIIRTVKKTNQNN